jgi:hypothetical protein
MTGPSHPDRDVIDRGAPGATVPGNNFRPGGAPALKENSTARFYQALSQVARKITFELIKINTADWGD